MQSVSENSVVFASYEGGSSEVAPACLAGAATLEDAMGNLIHPHDPH